MEQMRELLPCPFCGGPAQASVNYVSCECGVILPTKQWNRRASPPPAGTSVTDVYGADALDAALRGEKP